eukprot:TRINITY_DN43995_c0_g1_i1.p3 TRINITY_DN43995_c0_g1~~TRINITY_DN43995_c0_g1_i1.p3  ORF type:complete len:140 (+),score=24.89 TRINITY_DN43995_c0_g1_i1:76-495(+)
MPNRSKKNKKNKGPAAHTDDQPPPAGARVPADEPGHAAASDLPSPVAAGGGSGSPAAKGSQPSGRAEHWVRDLPDAQSRAAQARGAVGQVSDVLVALQLGTPPEPAAAASSSSSPSGPSKLGFALLMSPGRAGSPRHEV